MVALFDSVLQKSDGNEMLFLLPFSHCKMYPDERKQEKTQALSLETDVKYWM